MNLADLQFETGHGAEITPDGIRHPRNTEDPQGEWELREMQQCVGGYIQTVPVVGRPDLIMLVNEDGRLKRLAANLEASRLAGQAIVGRALLVRAQDFT